MIVMQKITIAEELPRIIKLHVDAAVTQGSATNQAHEPNLSQVHKFTQRVTESAVALRRTVRVFCNKTLLNATSVWIQYEVINEAAEQLRLMGRGGTKGENMPPNNQMIKADRRQTDRGVPCCGVLQVVADRRPLADRDTRIKSRRESALSAKKKGGKATQDMLQCGAMRNTIKKRVAPRRAAKPQSRSGQTVGVSRSLPAHPRYWDRESISMAKQHLQQKHIKVEATPTTSTTPTSVFGQIRALFLLQHNNKASTLTASTLTATADV
jgi:hypothetical protein